ncbi:MAG: hypothetical protein KJN71_02245 [Acidimicrobiia bacterium]|nr:hypothetical protein [Acidimicrobiia bacterium]NNC75804.1 hypothetical protein [Acidimicrobiia bacterium]
MRHTMTALLLLVALIGAACSGDDEPATTSIPSTTLGALDTTTTSAGDTTTTSTSPPAGVFTVPDYSIVERIEGEDGDIVVVQLDPNSYESLDSEDLINVVADVVDRFPPIGELHIVDSDAAAASVLIDSPSASEAAELADHYFVRLEEGARIVFVNTFSDAGQVILGS